MDKGHSNTPNFGQLLNQANRSFPRQYRSGVNAYFRDLDRFLSGEQSARATYDPQAIEHQQQLQSTYGPTQYAQQLDALRQIDPTGYALREQAGNALSSDLAAGHGLTKEQDDALGQDILRSQAERGNVYGQAPVQAEAFMKGQYGDQLYQQRLQNAMNFQNSATPESWISAIAPVSADRTSAYVNPNAGFLGVNASNAALQNVLGAQALGQQNNSNPWGSVLSSFASIAPLLIGAFA